MDRAKSRWAGGIVLALVTLVAALLPASAPASASRVASAGVAEDYRSYFAETALEGTGWATCPAPVTWSVHTGPLRGVAARREIRRLRQALRPWAEAAGVAMSFAGREELRYDPATHQLSSADGTIADRHVYVAFLPEGVSPLLVDPVAGFGMPARVWASTRTIATGMIVARARHVRAVADTDPDAIHGLYLHELGHAFGLGHADSPRNAMHPLLRSRDSLGPGDITGAQSLRRPC